MLFSLKNCLKSFLMFTTSWRLCVGSLTFSCWKFWNSLVKYIHLPLFCHSNSGFLIILFLLILSFLQRISFFYTIFFITFGSSWLSAIRIVSMSSKQPSFRKMLLWFPPPSLDSVRMKKFESSLKKFENSSYLIYIKLQIQF